jgi:N6-L-threonylcarbamoyladenine synthase
MLVLGIESSCDETAAAVVRDGREILSSVIASQIEMHKPWGGVVPELASREHLEKIDGIVSQAMADAGVGFDAIDAVAVTQGPGLIGSLLVGVCYGKSLAYGIGKPLIGVNHIEGHVYSIVFENPPVQYPALALIVSGGHTNIFHIPAEGQYKVVSRTRDDAAGEAFDKVAKMLGLGYPGGPIIERLAMGGDASKVKFSLAKISDGRPDLSFSGLKTAVLRTMQSEVGGDFRTPSTDLPKLLTEDQVKNMAASFQYTAYKTLTRQLKRAYDQYQPKSVVIAGGVAASRRLRAMVSEVIPPNRPQSGYLSYKLSQKRLSPARR